jgi:hypothetical protein
LERVIASSVNLDRLLLPIPERTHLHQRLALPLLFYCIMSGHPTKGGVKGGHAVSVETQFPSNHFAHQTHCTQDHSLPEQYPKGLTNVGNSCYANAALQCLLSTALTNALLNPEVVPLFRRYSSNPNLLAKGSGSVDSADDEDIVNPDSKRQNSDTSKESTETERLRQKEKEENQSTRGFGAPRFATSTKAPSSVPSLLHLYLYLYIIFSSRSVRGIPRSGSIVAAKSLGPSKS